jgi:TolC family type I secretion outer membrane protein
MAATACVFLSLGLSEAVAQTLEEALVKTYQGNPTIGAQRAKLRAVDEQVPQALANWRPTVSFSSDIGYANESVTANDNNATALTTPTENRFERSYALQVAQPVFRGFRTEAETKRAEMRIEAEKQRLSNTEQQVMRDAIIAFMDVVRDEAVLDLSVNNEQVLRKQLEATIDRFEVGEVTRTDVSQAEARLARATSDRITAEGQLEVSRATYQRFVGDPPGKLTEPPPPRRLPTSLPEAIELSKANNPTVAAADYDYKASEANIDLVFGELLPTVQIIGELRKMDNTLDVYSRDNLARVFARFSVPLYEQGLVYSRVREAKQQASTFKVQIDEARRQVVQQTIASWEEMTAARARVESYTKESEANRIALDGVEQEAAAGLRTVLDVLDAEQELFTSRVNLVRARHDYVVGAYRVKVSVGALTVAQLELPIESYNADTYADWSRDKWFGTGVPQAIDSSEQAEEAKAKPAASP